MSVFIDLRGLLIGHAGLTALVGQKVFDMQAPQKTAMPYVTFQRISTQKIRAMGRNRPDSNSRFQFNCVAANSDAARAVAVQINAALDRQGGGSIETCFHANENDFDDEAPERYRTQVDFMVHYRE